MPVMAGRRLATCAACPRSVAPRSAARAAVPRGLAHPEGARPPVRRGRVAPFFARPCTSPPCPPPLRPLLLDAGRSAARSWRYSSHAEVVRVAAAPCSRCCTLPRPGCLRRHHPVDHGIARRRRRGAARGAPALGGRGAAGLWRARALALRPRRGDGSLSRRPKEHLPLACPTPAATDSAGEQGAGKGRRVRCAGWVVALSTGLHGPQDLVRRRPGAPRGGLRLHPRTATTGWSRGRAGQPARRDGLHVPPAWYAFLPGARGRCRRRRRRRSPADSSPRLPRRAPRGAAAPGLAPGRSGARRDARCARPAGACRGGSQPGATCGPGRSRWRPPVRSQRAGDRLAGSFTTRFCSQPRGVDGGGPHPQPAKRNQEGWPQAVGRGCRLKSASSAQGTDQRIEDLASLRWLAVASTGQGPSGRAFLDAVRGKAGSNLPRTSRRPLPANSA
jgi:hypothetical protein